MFRHALFALAASVGFLSPAAASGLDAPDARLSWRLGFGGATAAVQTGYSLGLGYRTGEPDAPAAQLLELDVSDRAALARLAGLPLFGRDYRAHQAEGEALAESGPSPWYARKWVWWTAGSLAATAALAGGASGGETTYCTGICNQGSGGGPPTTVYTGDGSDPTGAYVGCAEGQCVMCPNGEVASDCSGYVGSLVAAVARDVERDRWLDAGTGHMGDLIAR